MVSERVGLLWAGSFHGAPAPPHPQILSEAAHLGAPAAAQAVLQDLHEQQAGHQALQEFGDPHQLHIQGPVSHVVIPRTL